MTTSEKNGNNSAEKAGETLVEDLSLRNTSGRGERPDTFNDKQSQIAERKTGDGRGPGNHSREAV
jgi:hypothetical protein